MSDKAREVREAIARGVKHKRPSVPVRVGSNRQNVERQRKALEQRTRER